MKKILIINGSGGSGKGAFVECLSKYARLEYSSIADTAKEIAIKLGWDGSKTDKDRLFLYELKKAIDKYNDYNYKRVRREIQEFQENSLELYCVDMREKEQIERARKEFGALAILVERDNVAPIGTNPADAGVKDIEYDIVIKNNGAIGDLLETARNLVKEWRKKDANTYDRVIYISHPYGGKEENRKAIEDKILELNKLYPNYLFVSAVSAFGFQYESLPYEDGLKECLWLLDRCNEMWLFGDEEEVMVSKGCNAEIDYCLKNDIEWRWIN